MSDQLPLFGAPQTLEAAVAAAAAPLARRSDSAGSKAAARALVRSGRRDTHEDAVLEALARRPWCTSLELDRAEHEFLASRGVKDRTEAARRLPGLLERGLVIRLRQQDNPTIKPCRWAESRCHRWAVASADAAHRALQNPLAIPVIDTGASEKVLAQEVAC